MLWRTATCFESTNIGEQILVRNSAFGSRLELMGLEVVEDQLLSCAAGAASRQLQLGIDAPCWLRQGESKSCGRRSSLRVVGCMHHAFLKALQTRGLHPQNLLFLRVRGFLGRNARAMLPRHGHAGGIFFHPDALPHETNLSLFENHQVTKASIS